MSNIFTLLRPTATAEDNRVYEREVIRQELAGLVLTEQRIKELTKQIQELESRADEAAARHCEICQPIQKQLTTIELRIVNRLANREPVDAADESERSQLVKQISAANETLKRETQLVQGLVKPLKTQLSQLNPGHVSGQRIVLENRLAGQSAGNPELLAQLFVAKRSLDIAADRERTAKEKLSAYEADLQRMHAEAASTRRDIAADSLRLTHRRIADWKLELTTARQLGAAANHDVNEIRRKLIAE